MGRPPPGIPGHGELGLPFFEVGTVVELRDWYVQYLMLTFLPSRGPREHGKGRSTFGSVAAYAPVPSRKTQYTHADAELHARPCLLAGTRLCSVEPGRVFVAGGGTAKVFWLLSSADFVRLDRTAWEEAVSGTARSVVWISAPGRPRVAPSCAQRHGMDTGTCQSGLQRESWFP